jgi:protein SMG9
MLSASPDRLLALDTQPLFSASVLADMASCWKAPPAALAAPAVAAAGEGKAAAVPYEGVQALAQLQLAVLLLSACHRVLVFCDGWADRRTWEFLQTAEMLARGVPDPSLPPREQQPQQAPATPAAGASGGAAAAGAGVGAGGAAQAAAARQVPPPQEHLAEVVLVHVLSEAAQPTPAQLQQLERRLDAFFTGSRLRRPGARVGRP